MIKQTVRNGSKLFIHSVFVNDGRNEKEDKSTYRNFDLVNQISRNCSHRLSSNRVFD